MLVTGWMGDEDQEDACKQANSLLRRGNIKNG